MTHEERIRDVAEFGFTERQAGFLTTVMLFGGVCVPRQYATFAGTAYGRRVNAFFDKLVRLGFAVRCHCIHNRARLYQVRHRPLYDAIGEGRSRYRRPVPAAQAIHRVIRLDAVLGHREVRWLATESEKIDFVRATVPAFPDERLPHVMVGRRVQRFPDDVAIGVDSGGRPVLVHVFAGSFEEDLRAVIQRYADLLAALPHWTVRLMLPPGMESAAGAFQIAFRDELATPFSATTLDELRWYFGEHRLAATTRSRMPLNARFRRAQRRFAAPRFRLLYRRWVTDGEGAFDMLSTVAIVDHLANQTGSVETRILPFSYQHLSPVVSPSVACAGVEKEEEKGEETSARPQPPRAGEDDDVAAQCARDWWRLMNAGKSLSAQ